MDTLFASVRDLLRKEMSRRNIRLEIRAAEVPPLRADRDQIQQVLINLVQNAADAIQNQGTITLSAREGVARLARASQPVIMLEVTDTGPGVPADVAQKIFDPFFSTKEGGTGLGLPIAARIVELHGGFVQYASDRAGGTTFSVLLPRPTNHESQSAPDRG